jgi:hypothetical protein
MRKTFTLQIEMESAAFDNPDSERLRTAGWRGELSRLLHQVGEQMADGWDANRVIHDINGNTVGQCGVADGD